MSQGTACALDIVPAQDAPLVARLQQRAQLCSEVTNTPELLMAWETDNLLYGRTNNPWNLERSPGGSSGGEAAAIAAGMSAGWRRQRRWRFHSRPLPTSPNLRDIKPTPGRISATVAITPSLVVTPRFQSELSDRGNATVADLKILFEVMQGPDIGDTCAAPVPLLWPSDNETRNLRIGYFEDDGRTPVTRETRAAVRIAAEGLRSAGFQVEPFQPEGLEQARQLWWKYFVVAGGMLLRPMFEGREADLSPILKQFLEISAAEPPLTADTLLNYWIERDLLRARFFAQMQRYPILLCPAAAIPAFRHGERRWQVEGKTVDYLDAWSYTEFFQPAR